MLAVDSSGVTYQGQGSTDFDTGSGYTHSDFGTNLIYSDGGQVAGPTTGAIVGSYAASGLVAPDSSLNRVFILGQTEAQANSNSYTIESFDQKAYTYVSSITLDNLSGSPLQLVRWGDAGLAIPTTGGMLYLIEDATFVSKLPTAANHKPAIEHVRRNTKQWTAHEYLEAARKARLRAMTADHAGETAASTGH